MVCMIDEKNWLNHIKSVIIKDMKISIEVLGHENLEEHVFRFTIRHLENGIEFLKKERMDKKS